MRPTETNAERVWAALPAFGAPMSQLVVDDFCATDVVFQIGVAPQRVDLLTSISRVEFTEAWPNRLVTDLDGLKANVIGRRELLQNKMASARPKDLLDADILREDTRK